MAKEVGVKLAVNTDAHSTRKLEFISVGINQTGRAWLKPQDVLNTVRLKEFRSLVRRRRCAVKTPRARPSDPTTLDSLGRQNAAACGSIPGRSRFRHGWWPPPAADRWDCH